MKHCVISAFTLAQSISEEDTNICENVGTSTTLFPKPEGNINVLLLNDICLPVNWEIHYSEITMNQGVTGICTLKITYYYSLLFTDLLSRLKYIKNH
jgi:hypothetical protein